LDFPNNAFYFLFLISFGVVAGLARQGCSNTVGMLEVPVTSFATAIDEAGPLEIAN
jgi:hypothetical protein